MRRIGVLAAWLLACSPPTETATARLALRALPSCVVPDSDLAQVRASGDFPSEQLDVDRRSRAVLDAFPADTRWLAIEVSEGARTAGSLVALDGDDQEAGALLLPFGRSCPLGDPLAAAPKGAALAALSNGGLLLAGGTADGTAATALAAVLPPGDPLAHAVPGGMLLRRAGASATRVGTSVVIAGGGPANVGAAHEVFEVYEEASDTFDAAQSANLTGGPRRDHGAVRLPDGRVLLAGGVSEVGGEPLASAELITLGTGDSIAIEDCLRVPRSSLQLLALGSGVVLAALGQDASGPVAEVERFDPETRRFELVAAELPARPEAAVAVLEGDRIAYLGCSQRNFLAPTCELWWILPDGDGFMALPSCASCDDVDECAGDPCDDNDLGPRQLARAGLSGLTDLRAAALGDGRLLVTGRDYSEDARAFVIDPNGPSIAPIEASRVADRLVALADWAIAEVDAVGTSLRRLDVRSELEDPPESLLEPGAVALDAVERWQRGRTGELVASRDGARFDLPRLRFARLRVELEIEGSAELLLEPEGAPAIAIAVTAQWLGWPECELERGAAAAIAIERDGDRITLESGGRRRTCAAPNALAGRVGVALRAAEQTRIDALRVVRR